MSLESSIVKAIMKRVIGVGGWAVKNHGSPFSTAGAPDMIVLIDGVVIFIEVKRPGCEPTKIQKHRAAQIAAAGGSVGVAHSLREAEEILGLHNVP